MGLLASPTTAPTAMATAKAMTAATNGSPTLGAAPAPAATAAPDLAAAAALDAESFDWTASRARLAARSRRMEARTTACRRSRASLSEALFETARDGPAASDARLFAGAPLRLAPEALRAAGGAMPLRAALRARTLSSMAVDAPAARAAASSPDDAPPSPPAGAKAAADAAPFLSLRESLALSRLLIFRIRAPPNEGWSPGRADSSLRRLDARRDLDFGREPAPRDPFSSRRSLAALRTPRSPSSRSSCAFGIGVDLPSFSGR